MSGMVTGGWGFVWSAYLITATLLGVYAVTTIVRFRRSLEERRHRQG